MDFEDAKEALLQVARERLKLYPGLVERFEEEFAWRCAIGQWRERLAMARMQDDLVPRMIGPIALPRALLAIVDGWAKHHVPSVRPLAAVTPNRETAQQRRARRWKMCVDAGLAMPTETYAQFPRGYGAIAAREGVTRQSFKEDLDAYRNEQFAR